MNDDTKNPPAKPVPKRSPRPATAPSKLKSSTNKPKSATKAPKSVTKAPKSATKAPNRSTKAQDLAELTKTWNQKLAESGFHDLELWGRNGEPSTQWLRGASLRNIADQYCPLTERHYARMRNFLTWNKVWTSSAFHDYVARAYTEGIPYSAIGKASKRRGMHSSKNEVFKAVHAFVAVATLWNKLHHEGLDFAPDV